MAMAASAPPRALLAHNAFVKSSHRNFSSSGLRFTPRSPLLRLRAVSTPRFHAPASVAVEVVEKGKGEEDEEVDDITGLQYPGCVLPSSLNWLWSLSITAAEGPSHGDGARIRRRRGNGCSATTGVIFDLEGVIIEDEDPELDAQAWCMLCREEKKQFPLDVMLRSDAMEGMKPEEVAAVVLGWSDDPDELQRLATRKEEIYLRLRGRRFHVRPGSREFINSLVCHGIPMAVLSAHCRRTAEEAIEAVGLDGCIGNIVSADDVQRGKPAPEMFDLAAGLIGLEPESCIVIGNSDATIEAADNAGMRSIALACTRPIYEFRSGARVVRWLDELSIADLKGSESAGVFKGREPRYMQMEMRKIEESCGLF